MAANRVPGLPGDPQDHERDHEADDRVGALPADRDRARDDEARRGARPRAVGAELVCRPRSRCRGSRDFRPTRRFADASSGIVAAVKPTSPMPTSSPPDGAARRRVWIDSRQDRTRRGTKKRSRSARWSAVRSAAAVRPRAAKRQRRRARRTSPRARRARSRPARSTRRRCPRRARSRTRTTCQALPRPGESTPRPRGRAARWPTAPGAETCDRHPTERTVGRLRLP